MAAPGRTVPLPSQKLILRFPMCPEKRGQQGHLPCEDPHLLTAAYNCTPDQVASYCRLYAVLAVGRAVALALFADTPAWIYPARRARTASSRRTFSGTSRMVICTLMHA